MPSSSLKHTDIKDHLIALLAKEVRSPLGGVQASLSILKGELDQQAGERIEEIRSLIDVGGRRIQEVYMLLEAAQDAYMHELAEANNEEPTWYFQELFDHVFYEDIFQQAQRRKVELLFNDPESPIRCKGNSKAYILVLRCYLDATLKSAASNRAIEVSGSQEGDYAVVLMRDPMSGLSATELESLDNGRQPSAALRRNGIGLKAATAIARYAGAGFEVSYLPGKGLEAKLSIPAVA